MIWKNSNQIFRHKIIASFVTKSDIMLYGVSESAHIILTDRKIGMGIFFHFIIQTHI